MNIKNFKNEMLAKANIFKNEKERLEKIFENGKKNGEEINFICNEILDNIHSWNRGDLLAFDFGYLEANIEKIQNIVRGVKNEDDN